MPECDVVIGSRTVSNFIWRGANMGWFLQWGNWAVAKLIEVLYNTTYLSDVGCTFRVMTKEHAEVILERSRLDGSAYGLEMLLHLGHHQGPHGADPGQLPLAGRASPRSPASWARRSASGPR